MEQVQNMELSKDQIIQELIALLNQNQQKEVANDVFEMATLIDGMGKRLEQVTEELSSVRKQLEKMEQEKADKTLKATVRKAVESLEQQCQKMKQQLFEIKIEVKAKASEIVAEAKAKGKAALHEVSEFLGIRDKLESVRENVRKSIAETEHTINKLDAFGKEAYQSDANELAEQITLLSVKIEETAGKLAVMESEYQKAEEDMKQIIRYSHIEKLTQDVVDTFISKVYAYKDKRVEIEWNFSVDRGCRQAKAT